MTPAILLQKRLWRLLLAPAMAAALFLLSPLSAASQDADDYPPVSQDELDQALAPIALYPDELLSQILMASTYPLEIVEAARFVEANPRLEGGALTEALELRNWDPSVNSLVNFPDVLESLSNNLTWTRKIGDAFLDDEGRVFDTLQDLRYRAEAAGNLRSSDQLTVSRDGRYGSSGRDTIVIESPNTQYVYVPVYDPTVVYGNWWLPSYLPPVYYRPRYYRPGIGLTFGLGFSRGSAWGYAWGRPNWRNRSLSIDLNRNARYNSRINRSRYRNLFGIGAGIGALAWSHDRSHRRGVSYRNRRTASRFDGRSRRDVSQSRRSYRGFGTSRSSRSSTQVPSRSRTTTSTRSRTVPRATTGSRSRTVPRRTTSSRTRTTTRSRTQTSPRSRTRTSPFSRSRTTLPTTRSATRGRSSRSVQRRSSPTRTSPARTSRTRSTGSRSRGRGN